MTRGDERRKKKVSVKKGDERAIGRRVSKLVLGARKRKERMR